MTSRSKNAGRRDFILVGVNCELDLHAALKAFAAEHELNLSSAARKLLRAALEEGGAELVALNLADEGYQDGRREGLQAFHQALAQLTNRFKEQK